MFLTKVNSSQNKSQSPIIGVGNTVDNFLLLFVCKYLHFSQIILNTHTHTHTHAHTHTHRASPPTHTLKKRKGTKF
jgi:hypothetical protein